MNKRFDSYEKKKKKKKKVLISSKAFLVSFFFSISTHTQSSSSRRRVGYLSQGKRNTKNDVDKSRVSFFFSSIFPIK
ncbi:Uncharacterized protein APZ42_026072 [Daphnia magna]|uniref:Uncharacterized protein n=1 Tax=Daphnia magna TaxID=35525 RepID=A0A164SIW1_9CRUS|nr:Uncharacterized protein APZ42_026072 [Daphnia magna]